MKYSWRRWHLATSIALILAVAPQGILAATTEDVKILQAEIQNKKAQVESISKQLEAYKDRIAAYQAKASSLASDVILLENEQAMAELDIVATQTQLQSEELELQLIQKRTDETNAELVTQKTLLKDVLFSVHKQDQRGGAIEILLQGNTFNNAFHAAAQLAEINTDLQNALVTTQETKGILEKQAGERAKKIASLAGLEESLQKKAQVLDETKIVKETLLQTTKSSEDEYRALLAELRQEQKAVSARIGELQENISKRLAEEDASSVPGQATSISWPITGRITTTFHDPTYPFRNLFEHSGLDIAVPQGTAIEASAPGIVAWAKTGRMYGNYVMIIHANGLATLYAHMSRMDVVQDQYVARGQVIGLSGGRAGAPGSGFSTGPHVHFEIREDGIPTDPYKYLP